VKIKAEAASQEQTNKLNGFRDMEVICDVTVEVQKVTTQA